MFWDRWWNRSEWFFDENGRRTSNVPSLFPVPASPPPTSRSFSLLILSTLWFKHSRDPLLWHNQLHKPQWLQRTSLTSQYSFNLSVRSTLFCLPSPVPKTKQLIRKSLIWENLKSTASNLEMMESLMRREGERESEMGQISRREVAGMEIPFWGMIERGRKSQFFFCVFTFLPSFFILLLPLLLLPLLLLYTSSYSRPFSSFPSLPLSKDI